MPELEHKPAGKWWSGDVNLVKLRNCVFALDGWDGEKWADCWLCKGKSKMRMANHYRYVLTPIYDRRYWDSDTMTYRDDDGNEWDGIRKYRVDYAGEQEY